MPSPDNHFTAGPDCCVHPPLTWCVDGAGGCPTVRARIVSPAGVKRYGRLSAWDASAPDNHFTAGPHCRVKGSGRGRVGRAGGCPTIRAGIVSPAGVERACRDYPPHTIISAPVQTAVWRAPGSGRVGGAGGCPTVRAGIVSPAGVRTPSPRVDPPQTIISVPVQTPVGRSRARGRVGGTGGCPTIRAGIVSPASVVKC